MTGLLSVIAWGNRLHNYSGSLTGPENTLSENTLGRNNLMKSWEDRALTVWCVPRNSQFFWSLQLHDFNDGTLYWWGWWQWCNIFLTTWSGGGQNWNELPRLIRGHGTVDPKEPVNHSLNATPHGWLGPSNTCCVGAIQQSVPPLSSLGFSSSQGSMRSESPWQWTRTTLLNAAPQPKLVGWAHFLKCHIQWPITMWMWTWANWRNRSNLWLDRVKIRPSWETHQEKPQCAKCVERKGTLTTSWDTLRKTISLGWLKPAISVERTPGLRTVWGSTGNKQIISSKTILRTRDGLRKHLALTSTPTDCDWAQAPGTGLEFSRKNFWFWLNSYNLRAALWEIVTSACNLNIPVEAFTEECLT